VPRVFKNLPRHLSKFLLKNYGILSFSQLAINGSFTLAKFVRKNVRDIAFLTCLGQYKLSYLCRASPKVARTFHAICEVKN
jgi:hypothetical protein